MESKIVLMVTSIGIALLAGTVLPFQAAANATVGRALGHPFWGATVSLFVSLVVMIPLLSIAKAPLPNFTNALQGPWWLWIGGMLGAIYVASATALIPKLGAGGFLVAVVAGQMISAVIVDHFGVMGLETKPINLMRIIGIILILGGVIMIQFSDVNDPVITPSSPNANPSLP